MCSPAPVVNRYGSDVADRFGIPTTYGVPGPGGVFLGSVGDQAHATRTSSHNCAPNSQESAVNGVAYHPDFAHAWDCRPASNEIGMDMVRATLPDRRVRYINFADVRYFPDGRTESTDHPTYHVSFLPGTHDDTRPFFGATDQGDLTMADAKAILDKLNDLDGKVPGLEQQKRDRNKTKARDRLARADHELLVEIAAAQDDARPIDRKILKAARDAADAARLALADDPGEN